MYIPSKLFASSYQKLRPWAVNKMCASGLKPRTVNIAIIVT
jgi:hypothetical protein